VRVLDEVQLKNGKPQFVEIWIWWKVLLTNIMKHPFWFQPFRICSYWNIFFFLNYIVQATKSLLIVPFLVYNFSVSSIQRPQYHLVEWQSLCFSRSKKDEKRECIYAHFSNDNSSLGKEESNHCGKIWKDSISWYYQKLLLIKWTIFRTSFQTPSTGIFEE